MLPKIRKASKIGKTVQLQFGGYDRRPEARDGTFRETEGMSQREFPVMATAATHYRRGMSGSQTRNQSLCVTGMGDRLLWIEDGRAQINDVFIGYMDDQDSQDVVPFGTKAVFPLTREIIDLSIIPKGVATDSAFLPTSAAEGEGWVVVGSGQGEMRPHLWVMRSGAWTDTGPMIRSLEASVTLMDASFEDGTYVGEAADMNTIRDLTGEADFTALFKVGDAVQISGCLVQPRNNQTLIIREVTKDKLKFYENSFRLPSDGKYVVTDEDGIPAASVFRICGYAPLDTGGEIFQLTQALAYGDYLVLQKDAGTANAFVTVYNKDGELRYAIEQFSPSLESLAKDMYFEELFRYKQDGAGSGYMEFAPVTIRRSWPEGLSGLFADSNRLWGWQGRTLRASKLGDPSNWDFFDGTAEDSWAVELQWPETITGGISAHGYPTFYTERRRIRIYGATPEAYQTSELDCIGVREGCGKSLAVVDGVLYYVSREGVMRDDGALPTLISAAFGPLRLEQATAGGTGHLLLMAGTDQQGNPHLFSFDSRSGVWIRENGEKITQITTAGGRIFATAEREKPGLSWVELLCFGTAPGWGPWAEDGDKSFLLETNDYTMAQSNTKRVHRVQLRMLLESRTRVEVSIQYDESGSWTPAARLQGDGQRRSVYLPILPRRCDRFRLRFQGAGQWRLESLALELRSGSPELAPGPRFTD